MGCLSNILPLVLLIGINWAETEIQTRRLTCGADQSHTLCLPDVGNACQVNNDYLVDIGLSTKEQNEMVDLHNKYRADIAEGKVSGLPPASNMQKMSWNEDLAQVAQKWADQCLFDHDTGDARKTPQFEHVGQNIYLQKISKKVPGIKVKKAVKKWFGEVQDFDEHQISPFEFTYNTGHFSQLVWAETSEIGCGVSNWMDGRRWKRLVVCNYGPAGNFAGASMYIEGDPCSQCPSGTSCSDGALCAA